MRVRRVGPGLLLASGMVWAAFAQVDITGRVVDGDGKPVEGARACLMVAGAEGLCDATDGDGFYGLPSSEVASVRIVARGYLPRSVAAVSQESPVVLEKAASLRVRLLDKSTKKGLSGEVVLAYTSGRKLGPFPTNAAGVSLPTLPQGETIPTGRAEGYFDLTGPPVTLVAGSEKAIVLELEPRSAAGQDAGP